MKEKNIASSPSIVNIKPEERLVVETQEELKTFLREKSLEFSFKTLSQRSKIPKTTLYFSLGPRGNLSLNSLMKILKALNLTLQIVGSINYQTQKENNEKNRYSENKLNDPKPIVIKFEEIKQKINISDLKSKTGIEEPITLVDGFIKQPFNMELSTSFVLGGPIIPMIMLLGESGRIYFFALKAILNKATLKEFGL